MNTFSRVTKVVAFVYLIVMLGGCAATQARVEAGGTFATAGIAYVDALPAVFDESFKLIVSANTHQLLLAREDLTEDERADRLETANELLESRLTLLRKLRRHSLLLRSYFIALQALTANDNASGINTAAQGVVSSIAELRPGIEESTIGDVRIADLIEPGINLIVGAYQNAALQRELEARGEAIARELALQKEVITALTEEMIDNAGLIIEIEELNPIYDDYVSADRVSDSWNDKRLSAYKRTVSLQSYDDIRRAAANMESTWVALVEKRDSEASISLLIEDIERFLAIARLFKASE